MTEFGGQSFSNFPVNLTSRPKFSSADFSGKLLSGSLVRACLAANDAAKV